MRTFTAVVVRDRASGLYVGHVIGVPGAYTQGETHEELRANLREVLEMALEDDPDIESEFVGTSIITVEPPESAS